jgi:hypothetical protein
MSSVQWACNWIVNILYGTCTAHNFYLEIITSVKWKDFWNVETFRFLSIPLEERLQVTLRRALNRTVVICIKVTYLHLPVGAEDNYKHPVSRKKPEPGTFRNASYSHFSATLWHYVLHVIEATRSKMLTSLSILPRYGSSVEFDNTITAEHDLSLL